MVDALVSNTNVFGRAGSTPAQGTAKAFLRNLEGFSFYLTPLPNPTHKLFFRVTYLVLYPLKINNLIISHVIGLNLQKVVISQARKWF